jgi:UDP-GlcNAc:undecaprenyl-phosphate/decaprenyl-phosphate GlcNAc-1-phosphate transferase
LTALYFGIFLLSLVLSFVLTWYVRNVATERGWVAPPADGRHLHETPLPRLGGVAIFGAFVLSLGVALAAAHLWPRLNFNSSGRILTTILGPGLLIFLLGLYDDVRSVGPYVKFSVQALAASLLYASGLRITDLPVVFGHRQLPTIVGLGLTILWVLGITNAFNLIDGLDGLAAGSALFSTVVVFVVALLGHYSLVALMTIALAGAILGFLRYNFNPATIFLGDCGSQFVGFLLSALALEGAQKAPTIIAVAIPVVSFGLPILETSLSVLRRLISGRPVFTADREHIHHRLLALGMSHRQVVIVLYAVSALFALLSLFLLWPTGSTLGLVLAVVGTGVWLGVQHLGYLEFGELRRVAQRTLEQRQIVINNLSIRRATEELKVARDYAQVCRILVAAFDSNDFDAFDLHAKVYPKERTWLSHERDFDGDVEELHFHWNRPGLPMLPRHGTCWALSLDLLTTANRRRGAMAIHRVYSERTLQLDVNLVTREFPIVLADALDRVLGHEIEVLTHPDKRADRDDGMIAAQAG